MTEITCPYYWCCGKPFKLDQLSSSDIARVIAAKVEKIKLLFIHCVNCNTLFAYNANENLSNALHPVKVNLNEGQTSTIQQFTQILEKAKVEIPALYFNYLISDKFNPRISFFHDDEDFNLYDLNGLCEHITIDRKLYLTLDQLWALANSESMKSLEITKNKHHKQFTWNELSNCVTIGFENTRLLFVDSRDDNSLWIFHSNDGAIEKINLTLNELCCARE